MPIYEYRCENCGHCFEKLIFVADGEKVICPKCDTGDVKKLLSCSSFIGTSDTGSCSSHAPNGFS